MSDLIELSELLSELDREIKRVPACAATLQRARSIALTIPSVPAEVVRLRAAYESPPKPLTLEEVKAKTGCPVWCEDRDGTGAWALVTECDDKCTDADFGDWEFYCYGWTNERGWRAWLRRPTDEERAAVPWQE